MSSDAAELSLVSICPHTCAYYRDAVLLLARMSVLQDPSKEGKQSKKKKSQSIWYYCTCIRPAVIPAATRIPLLSQDGTLILLSGVDS